MTLAPLLLLSTPFLLSAGVAAVQHVRERRRPALPDLPEPAGPWARRTARRLGLEVDVDVVPPGAVERDAYWPSVALIALTPSTWHGLDPRSRAVAAHELGHALHAERAPALAALLPHARVALDLSWRGFLAVALAQLWVGGPWLGALALLLAVAALAFDLVVLADEAWASGSAGGLLADLPGDARSHAGQALTGALSTYGAEAAGRLLVVACWPLLAPTAAPTFGAANDPLAVWLLVLLGPNLLLRAGHVVLQAVRPEPVGSAFQLALRNEREGAWDLLAAAILAIVLLACRDEPFAIGLAPLLALAALPAVGPLAGIGRMLALLPFLLGVRVLAGPSAPPFADPAGRDELIARKERLRERLQRLHEEVPLSVRLAGLLRAAHVPVLVVMLVRLLDG